MTRIIAFDVAGMCDASSLSADGKTEYVSIRPARAGETPNLWSVLARMDDGHCEILADERRREKAMAFARAFRRTLRLAEEAAGFTVADRPIRFT
jgi:hypothetical protein